MHRIGIISDTHGLLRPEAAAALAGVEHILHAGDIGSVEVLDGLRAIAPVTAVRGNVDHSPGVIDLPDTQTFEIEGLSVYILHNLDDLEIDPAAGFKVVISGHTHQAQVVHKNGVMYVNPGSAGPSRFHHNPCLAVMQAEGDEIDVQVVKLRAG